MFMKIRKLFVAATLLALASLFFGWQSPVASARQPKILEFDTMVGNTQAFTGDTNPIRGINGGGLPWSLTSAKGELKTNGRLEINVQGLVLAAGPNAGSNPIANFAAIVSCLTGDGDVLNVATGTFPATTGPASQGGGDAKIETVVSLPQPCIAPIIFVTSPGGAWFAATGN
ncbi:MAG: hypothetical protein D8M54_17910 [Chloroflexi bacterium]|nr:hypothetical protein [Chloroflexota bacterium]